MQELLNNIITSLLNIVTEKGNLLSEFAELTLRISNVLIKYAAIDDDAMKLLILLSQISSKNADLAKTHNDILKKLNNLF